MARLAGYIGWNTWSLPTQANGTIQKATDYAIGFNPAASNETGALQEMFYVVGDVASIFGDPSGKYKAFLAQLSFLVFNFFLILMKIAF